MVTNRRSFLKTLITGTLALPMLRSSAIAGESDTTNLCQSVREVGPLFRKNPLSITGQDGATSCVLPNGKSLWLFGDTVEGPFESIRNHDLTEVLSNTAAIVPRQAYSEGIREFSFLRSADASRARQVIKFAPNEDKSRHRLWPIHSICVKARVYAFYHKITMDPERDVFDTFELDGMGIARAQVKDFRFNRLVAPDGTREFWKGDQPTFGVFTEKHSDGYVYLWGCFWTGMFLARTRPETIEQLDSYEYLVAGPTLESPDQQPVWDRACKNLHVLFDHVPNELSVSYSPYLKKHVAIHVWDRENKLVLRTAPHVYGPWSEAEVFYRPPRVGEKDLFTSAKEHPEMRNADGNVMYVTYVNSATYVPNLVELTLR